jgi:hypothetical protein
MATYAALNHTTWLDSYDMTSDLNQTSLSISKEPRDTTTFGTAAAPTIAHARIAGLEDVQSVVAGLWQSGVGLVDPQAFTNLGGLKVVTQTPAGVETERAYFYQARDFEYRTFGNVGDPMPFALAIQGARGAGALSAGAVAGYLAKAKGTVSATGVLGTGKQMGAVSASQFLYAAVHLFGTAATTITIIIESDDNSGFTTPTTRATIGPLTTVGGTWMSRVAGPFTDNWWRLNVSAITGTWTIGAAFGIK